MRQAREVVRELPFRTLGLRLRSQSQVPRRWAVSRVVGSTVCVRDKGNA